MLLNPMLKKFALLTALLPALTYATSHKLTEHKTTQPTQSAKTFVAGKDYQVLSATPLIAQPKGKVRVIEFFSYGCPWCNALEPTMESWLTHKPDSVVFDRVPVVFERTWQILARAYYAAKILNVEPKITRAFFDAIHKEGKRFEDPDSVKAVFLANGVSTANFDAAFTFSPNVDIALSDGKQLMLKLKIYRVPALVIGGRYLLRPDMVGGNYEKFKQALNYLIKQSQADKNKQTDERG